MVKATSVKGKVDVEVDGTFSEIMADTSMLANTVIDKMAKAKGISRAELKADFITALIILG